MAKRYFRNALSDSDESLVDASNEFWLDKVKNLVESICQNASTSPKNTVYTGTAGIAYMFYRLAISDKFEKDSITFLNKAVEVLKLKERSFSQRKLGQFICGDAGVSAVNAAIYHRMGDEKMAATYLQHFQNGINVCRPKSSLEPGEDELFVGRAGYLYGVLWLENVFGRKIMPDQNVIELCSIIVKSGRTYSKKNKSIFPLMYSYHNKEYLGAAHGISTILQILISFPVFVEKEIEAMQDVKKCIDILVSLQADNGNFPSSMSSRQRLEEDELVHWCHGAPGVVYLLAKAYLVFKEPSYLESCLRCGDLVWTKGLLKKGPGLCHGIAGNGYVFLLLYKLTRDKKHLNRALKFGEFMFTNECAQGSRIPDNPYSLYEGLAGTVCYLTDLMQPDKASFPFMDAL